jgi:hypothetical protein
MEKNSCTPIYDLKRKTGHRKEAVMQSIHSVLIRPKRKRLFLAYGISIDIQLTHLMPESGL